MQKIMPLALVFLCTAAWSQTGSGQMGTGASHPAAIEGCLHGAAGNYTLTDDSGTTYQLEGDTSKLSEHVGHEVRITGTVASSSSASSSTTMSSGGSQQPTLKVEKLKHISTTCKSTGK
jgi:hypothetical protein